MPGRNAQPIDILTAAGKKHLTKVEIEQRKNAEIKFGGQALRCPDYVKSDPQAHKKWKEISALYSGVDFVASGDVSLIGRYCTTHSEYLDLIARRGRINDITKDCDDVEQYIEDAEEFNGKIRQQLLDMCSTAAVLKIDDAINKKMAALSGMEDRLFLNPLAKVKNVPKPKEKEQESKWDKYKSG